MRVCFSAIYNDHYAYPRSLTQSPPYGWECREAEVIFDPRLGRPFCRFICDKDELILASSLLPSNENQWLFDTDHAAYLLTQARDHAGKVGLGFNHDYTSRALAQRLQSANCLGVLAWSEAARESIRSLFSSVDAPPPRMCVAYPAVIPPRVNGNDDQTITALLPGLRSDTVKLLIIDGQRGLCTAKGRKNVEEAVAIFRSLQAAQLPVELIIVGGDARQTPEVGRGIHVLPFLSREQLWLVYEHADILLFLSRQDSFGYVLLEAMYNGLVL